MSELWKQQNYLVDIPYLISNHIYEYDISKANINVLYALGEITKEYYDVLNDMTKLQREIDVGYMLRDYKDLSDKLKDGIAYFRKQLFEKNNLEDRDILAIKNDAIFVINKQLKYTTFGNVEFVLKNRYSIFLKLSKHLEIYFESDMVNGTISLDVKGIKDDKLELHHKYMASVIADVLYYMETKDINSGLTYLSEVYNAYVDKKLPIGYYRNFNAESKYIIRIGNSVYEMDYCTESMFNNIDIGCNLEILRNLYGYLTNLYMQQNI